MFAVVFALALATAYGAEFPSYINVCGRKNPNLNKCILDNIENLRSKICNGLTELNLPPLEPLNIERLVISDSPQNKIYLNDVKISGLCDFQVQAFNADLNDKYDFDFKLHFNRIYLNGTYDINVQILVPIVHKAPIYLTADDVKLHALLHSKMVTKGGKNRLYISELEPHIEMNGYDIKYGLTAEEQTELSRAVSDLISNNQEEFAQRFLPSLEEAVAKWMINIFNSFFKTFTYDELFPDRE
ncbi:uncharacterized protein LOC114939524 [Nylanderia fulva]|uniref:uncharacterized protein LOC114939524 n=1 Tax=Nylanderia fulva TaxID=613905 RepID=UPI0010FAF60F|nr:uncharacterized protein LOC114939524 [Nylanderia fulva]